MQFNLDTSIPIQFDELEQLSDGRFLRGKIWICHTGENRNRSTFSKEVISAAIPSLANIPVLGFIRIDNNNESDFAGHEQRIVIDKDGVKLEYLGRMYGIVPETNNAKFEIKLCEDGIEREFLTAEVLLHTKFQECIDIVQRDGQHSHSMELYPDSIQGKFNKDGLFEFTSFLFEGLCLLGEDVTPAMISSSLELFSQFNYQSQLKDMLQEFNTKFTQLANASVVESQEQVPIDNLYTDSQSNQGGETVNEKLELFAKFPTLSEEQVSVLKENIEQYSLEELETKLQELATNSQEDVNADDPQSNFALTSQQLKDELRLELSKYTHIDRWGDSCRQYWYVDHDDTRVYAEDGQQNYLHVGINYSMNGDTVVLDVESKKRIKWVPQDIEGDDVVEFSVASAERHEYDFNKVSEQFTTFKQESESKYSELEGKYTAKETEYSALKTDFEDIKSQYEEVNGKYTSKIEKEAEEKLNTLYSEFAKELTEDEISEVKTSMKNATYDDVEMKLFALVGKKKAKFSVVQTKPNHIDLTDQQEKNKKKTGKSYDELFEKYVD